VETEPEAAKTASTQRPLTWPPSGKFGFQEPVSRDAQTAVDAIAKEALELGWTEAQLYQNRGQLKFPSGGEYGLICFLRGNRKIVGVTAQAIRLKAPSGSIAKYYSKRPGVKHPAITHI